MSKHVSQLAILTGLDDETIKQQIIPYLDTFTSRQALVNHLQDLLGPGEAQRSFIETYANERHPSKSTTHSTTNAASTLSSTAVSTINGSSKSVSKKKSKFPTKLPPPRKIDADAFGGVGSVYRKGDEDINLFQTSATSSGVSTPIEKGEINASAGIGRSQSPVKHAEVNASTSDKFTSASKAASEQDFTLIPSDEMKAVQQDISLLRGESREDPSAKAKPCFCQGRRHAIHPQVPLCMTCGLVLCSILHPSPLLLPSSPCPSCAAPILSTTSRAILLARLDLQLASLSQTHEEKIRLIQEEKERAWQEKRQEVELFPNLTKLSLKEGTGSNSTGAISRHNQEYNHFYERRRAMDIAMGRRVDDDAQRRARVIRIGAPANSKKKKKINTGKKPIEAAKETIKSPLDPVKKQEEEVPSSGEESEDEVILDYDPNNEFNGPMPNADGDGFARHGTSIRPENASSKIIDSGFWAHARYTTSIRYIPEKQRSSYVERIEVEGSNSLKSGKRAVSGAALESRQ